jgi:large subunit ribosomal protein L7/L12
MADIKAIVEEVKSLSVLELSELVKALEETFGVSAASMAAPAAGAGAAAAPAEEEKTEFDVVLAGLADPKGKIKVIKVVRELTGLGLADAKAAVENAPTTLKEAATKEEAADIKEKIEAAGGKVELK